MFKKKIYQNCFLSLKNGKIQTSFLPSRYFNTFTSNLEIKDSEIDEILSKSKKNLLEKRNTKKQEKESKTQKGFSDKPLPSPSHYESTKRQKYLQKLQKLTEAQSSLYNYSHFESKILKSQSQSESSIKALTERHNEKQLLPIPYSEAYLHSESVNNRLSHCSTPHELLNLYSKYKFSFSNTQRVQLLYQYAKIINRFDSLSQASALSLTDSVHYSWSDRRIQSLLSNVRNQFSLLQCQDLTVLYWALVKLRFPAEALFKQIWNQIESNVDKYNNSDLSVILYSSSKMKYRNFEHLEIVVNKISKRITELTKFEKDGEVVHDFHNFFTDTQIQKPIHPNLPLKPTKKTYMIKENNGFTSQSISNIFWSIGRLKMRGRENFLHKLSFITIHNIKYFKLQGLSNIFKACATLSFKNKELIDNCMKDLLKREFKQDEILNLYIIIKSLCEMKISPKDEEIIHITKPIIHYKKHFNLKKSEADIELKYFIQAFGLLLMLDLKKHENISMLSEYLLKVRSVSDKLNTHDCYMCLHGLAKLIKRFEKKAGKVEWEESKAELAKKINLQRLLNTIALRTANILHRFHEGSIAQIRNCLDSLKYHNTYFEQKYQNRSKLQS